MRLSHYFPVLFYFFISCGFLLLASVNSQGADSCNTNLTLNGLPFDSSSLHCASVWAPHNFILRYLETSTDVWSFVLSAPDNNSYIAMGFSPSGGMVGSSAVVGWVSADGTPTIRQYALRGQKPSQVVVNQGSLQITGNSSMILSQSSRLYLVFQLNTNQPLTRLIYSVGPVGVFPTGTDYELTRHRDQVTAELNYVTGQASSRTPYKQLRRSHGILNILGWGILMIIGAILARYFKQWDPIWFYSHTLVQSLGFVLGVAGVISGLVLENKLGADVSTHKGLGIFILVLGCLQVMAFLARPNKESKVRKYWNWYHHNMGRILIIFAIANIFYGIHLGEKGKGWNAGYGITIAILFLIAIVLEIRMWMRK
ncbi:cytochrome b561 and DOMON domain-containing protein [Citrus sinensis]|uniref:cytochrome b561 and DOMON domain-containing protein At3g07570 isoform X1 n=2 Tax=Citrus sinensis TaxID=2711 RepID=UPI0003D7553F|nr:cytochrome b561 and DOMON domain-containing protein At3g07570 isoform X1 [Citrus sinensis]KAH9745574.1 cytochrome b561 and DOMON domain-containing protein [Citrus sinensis]